MIYINGKVRRNGLVIALGDFRVSNVGCLVNGGCERRRDVLDTVGPSWFPSNQSGS
jgi:hypothetical protein